MLTAVPLIGSAFSVVSPDEQKLFLLVWLFSASLLGMIFMLALIDACNNIRLGKVENDRLKIEHRAIVAAMRQETARQREVDHGDD